jgi:hypothetical protein
MPFPLPNEGGCGLRPLEEILFVEIRVDSHPMLLYTIDIVV